MASKFCPSCGATRTPNSRFCAGCGMAYGGEAPAAPVATAAPTAPAYIPPSAAPASSGPVNPTGWQVLVGDGPPVVAPPPQATVPMGSAASEAAQAPAAKPAAQGPSIRGASFQMLILTVTDWAAAQATNEPTAKQLANVRLGLAAAGALTGLIAGRGRGFFSRLTQLSSLGLAVAQSPSLYAFGARVMANPTLLSGLLPNIATQGLSFLSAIRLVIQARKG